MSSDNPITFGSVCSGIEAASVAFGPLGWGPAWFAEIEAFPSAVLAHHYPSVKNLGDMTTIARRVLAGEVAAPDVLCGGTPCQAFSVAGLRNSLDDARGNLTLKFVELADAIDHRRDRDGKPAATILWENVPGVFSTKDNAFGCFLAGLAGEDEPLVPPGKKWTDAGAVYGPRRAIAWRTLDAQYFGLAQRRRRVFVVASARDGFDPAAVLFEWQGVRRDSAPRRGQTEDVAGTVAGGARKRGGYSSDDIPAVSDTLRQHTRPGSNSVGTLAFGGNNCSGPLSVSSALSAHGGSGRMDFESETFIAHSLRGAGFDASEDGSGRGAPLVFDTTQITSAENRSNPQRGDPCHPLAAGAHAPTIAYIPELAATMVARSSRGAGQINSPGHQADSELIAFNARQTPVSGPVSGPVDTDGGTQAVRGPHGVRRLTPRECERLQGFPDDYTCVPHRGKPAADGPRYKALGNSWAIPNVRWIGARIDNALRASA